MIEFLRSVQFEQKPEWWHYLFFCLFVLGVILAIRELCCWWIKTSTIVNRLDQTNEELAKVNATLEKIAGKK